MNYQQLQFSETQLEFHSNENIKFGYLVKEGLITLGSGDWDWEPYNEEQKARVIEQMNRKYFDLELNAPPYIWHLNFIQALVEAQSKYNPLYKAFDEGVNPAYSLDEWEKKRDINSDFPQTRIPNTSNNDYASEGFDMERELIRVQNPLDVVKQYVSDYQAVDTLFIDEVMRKCFSCVIVSHIDALY